MCQLAVDQTSNWLMVDTWEPMQKEYQPTAVVLDHFDHEINVVREGIDAGNGTRKPVRVALLAGADLIHTMSTPGVWSEKDLDHILGKYGVCSYITDLFTRIDSAHSLSLLLWNAAAPISTRLWQRCNHGRTTST
jgi:nicotinic acid mononucleotide adenylyltransferase